MATAFRKMLTLYGTRTTLSIYQMKLSNNIFQASLRKLSYSIFLSKASLLNSQ